jgi:hypothetical protein
MALILLVMAITGCTAFCGVAAGQIYGQCPVSVGMPVTVAGPGVAIVSVGGVTACAGPASAIASAGGIVAGASTLFPAAFAGQAIHAYPYCAPGMPI